MDIVIATLLLIYVCYVVGECLAIVVSTFFEDQVFAFFDATIGRFIDWLNT